MRVLLAFLLIFHTNAAQALSCAPYNPVLAFIDAAASADQYVVAEGVLDFNPNHLPRGGLIPEQEMAPVDIEFQASLTGFSLTHDGFNARFVRSIKVQALCLGPWCASLEPGERYLVFLKKTGAEYELSINPCGGFAFRNPSQEALDQIHACFVGETCDPDQP